MNNISLIGHIATATKKGNGVATSLIAVHRIYHSKDGITADFIPLSLFGTQVDNFQKYVKKGDEVGVDGRVQTGRWADKQGEIHYSWSVVVSHFYLVGNQDKEQRTSQSPTASQPQQVSTEQQRQQPSPATSFDTYKVSDDDLPF